MLGFNWILKKKIWYKIIFILVRYGNLVISFYLEDIKLGYIILEFDYYKYFWILKKVFFVNKIMKIFRVYL